MRYFLTLAYHGTAYSGWQRQPNAPSVQETLERALSTILRETIEVTGCGRTDTGVHARYYIAHFDAANDIPPTFLQGLNSLLPSDIAVYDCSPVADTAHARFDATERAYAYYITTRKNPFSKNLAWFYPQTARLDLSKMNAVANLLLQHESFFPFCKTNSGVDHYRCQLTTAYWEEIPDQHFLVFHIAANRFLRGMVRLIVGACIQAGNGQILVSDIQRALETQSPLPKSLSVPAEGLYLTRIKY